MPKATIIKRARRDERQGKAPSTQASEFVREEIEDVRKGKHGVRSTKQAIAIGLSKARRAGVKLAAPKAGRASSAVRKKAEQDLAKGKAKPKPVSRKRSQATLGALKKESTAGASQAALSKQTRTAAKRRKPTERSASARKAARTRARNK